MKKLEKYSLGIGDRFGQQGNTQLKAIMEAEKKGILITPVWNKSNREHLFTGTKPEDVRREAETAARNSGFARDFFVDADHINLQTVERFISYSDFFTIDVASFIDKMAPEDRIGHFTGLCSKYFHGISIPGLRHKLSCSEKEVRCIAEKYLYACIQAGDIYRYIKRGRDDDDFVIEVSIDEVSQSQSPLEIFLILRMLNDENIPVQTIAPKFCGRFNKGIDYSGNTGEFALEFESDLLVVSHAAAEFGLPENLKISVHSGSDKFSVYPVMNSLLAKHNKGIHLKTAGTTWLEEVIGLAESGNEALELVRTIYIKAFGMIDELCAPYSDLLSIRSGSLPTADEVGRWNGRKFASSIRHEPGNRDYNPDMRQLMHIAYKLAAQDMTHYLELARSNIDTISRGVFDNLYNRHIQKIFPGA